MILSCYSRKLSEEIDSGWNFRDECELLYASSGSVRLIASDGRRLLVFPEGTRVHDGEDVSAKGGAALFATRTGVPIVPVYVSRKKYWFRRSPVIIGKPITPKIAGRKATSEELEKIMNDVMEQIYRLGETA